MDVLKTSLSVAIALLEEVFIITHFFKEGMYQNISL